MSKTKSILLIFISLIFFSDILTSSWLGFGRSEKKSTFDQVLKLGSGAVLGGLGAVLLSGSLPFITLCTVAGGFLSRETTIINQSSQSKQELLSDYQQRGLQFDQLKFRMQSLTCSLGELRDLGHATHQQLEKTNAVHKETAAELRKNDLRLQMLIKTAHEGCESLLGLKSEIKQAQVRTDDSHQKILTMIDSFQDKPAPLLSTIAGLKEITTVRDSATTKQRYRSALLGDSDKQQLMLLANRECLAAMSLGLTRAEASGSSFGGAGAGAGSSGMAGSSHMDSLSDLA